MEQELRLPGVRRIFFLNLFRLSIEQDHSVRIHVRDHAAQDEDLSIVELADDGVLPYHDARVQLSLINELPACRLRINESQPFDRLNLFML